MKVVAFNGSSRRNGNTALLLSTVLDELSKEKIETELIQFDSDVIRGCIACYKCFEKKDNKCASIDDNLNLFLAKMIEADGILLGSPVYFTDVSANMKGFIERSGFVSKANGYLFKNKVGAAVVAVRRAGAVRTFDTLNHLFQYAQMIIVGSSYWNIGIGRDVGQVKEDEEGLNTMKTLGQNIAWLLKKIHN
jgi:multimeric flavodoxin WrbA